MKSFAIILFVISLVACQGKDLKNDVGTDQPNAAAISKAAIDTAKYTTIAWSDSIVELGTIKYGTIKEIKFGFTNSGTYPLFIIAADPSCGCTVADYPKEAIAPGESGTITAGYDTQNQHSGLFRKSIIVTTNTQGQVTNTLIFSGQIIKEGETPVKVEQPKAIEKKKEILQELLPPPPKKKQKL